MPPDENKSNRGSAATKFSRNAARRAAPNRNPAKRLRFGVKAQGNAGRDAREGTPNGMDFAPARGRTGFDGGAEAGIASGCACHPKNGQLIN